MPCNPLPFFGFTKRMLVLCVDIFVVVSLLLHVQIFRTRKGYRSVVAVCRAIRMASGIRPTRNAGHVEVCDFLPSLETRPRANHDLRTLAGNAGEVEVIDLTVNFEHFVAIRS